MVQAMAQAMTQSSAHMRERTRAQADKSKFKGAGGITCAYVIGAWVATRAGAGVATRADAGVATRAGASECKGDAGKSADHKRGIRRGLRQMPPGRIKAEVMLQLRALARVQPDKLKKPGLPAGSGASRERPHKTHTHIKGQTHRRTSLYGKGTFFVYARFFLVRPTPPR